MNVVFNFAQILMRDSIGLSEDQIKELRTSFNHFDKNGNNKLDYKEFKQCLVSLGHSTDIEDKVGYFCNNKTNFDGISMGINLNLRLIFLFRKVQL